MNIKEYFQKLHYQKINGIEGKIIPVLLWPFEFAYTQVVKLRILLYKLACLPSWTAEVPVISIGNITTGGTGKTPVTMALAEHLSTIEQFKVAILSRGYGKTSKENVTVVRDYNKIIADNASYCGDEPYMMAKKLNNVLILSGSKRAGLAKFAIENYNANILILDDGFQHMALNRDLNILVYDEENEFGNNRLLPAGPLREPLQALERADIIISVNKGTGKTKDLPEAIKSDSKQLVSAIYKPDGFVNIYTKEDIQSIKEEKVLAFTGIGQPESFCKTLNNAGLNVCKTHSFADHRNYTIKDIEMLNSIAKTSTSEAFITTEKDSVKLLAYRKYFKLPVYAIKMTMTFDIKTVLNIAGINE